MKNSKSVRLECGHFILVPGYQSAKPEDYKGTYCLKCDPSNKTTSKAAAPAPKK